MIRLSRFPRYLAWPGAPGVAQRPRKPSESMGRRPSVKSRSPVLGRRLWPHTPFHPPPTPPCYLGTEKEGKRPPLYLVPSSQALPADHLRREKTFPTHTHTLTTPSPTSCCSQAIPGCLLARGGMLVRRAPGARRAGTSPGRLMGKERRKNQKSLLAKTQKLGTSWPKAHERAGGSWPGTPRPPSPTRACPEPSCTPAAPVPFSARRMTRALLQRQLWGFLSI